MGAYNRSAVATLVGPCTRQVILVHLPHKSAEAVTAALTRKFTALPEVLRRTLTWDQGSEMSGHEQLGAQAGLEVSFCDPAGPWQRPSNENTNGAHPGLEYARADRPRLPGREAASTTDATAGILVCVSNALTLLARTRNARGLLPGGQPLELHFMEFVIDGQPLGRTLGSFLFYEDATQEYVSVLVHDWPINSAAVELDRLLGRQPDPSLSGRVAIYVCAECGDLGCGAITADVEVGTDHVVWRDVGYQNNYEPFDRSLVFEGVGPFTFDYGSYAGALETFRRQLPQS